MGSAWSQSDPKPASPPLRAFHVKKVAIIGAGPCGLAAAKYLKAQRAFDSVVLFEQQAQVGGVWNYTDIAPARCPVPQEDPFWGPEPPVCLPAGYGGHASAPVFPSPMYDKLHTNILGCLMEYTDQRFPHDARLFPSREAVRNYLLEYAEELRSSIRFCTRVKQLSLRRESGVDKWDLEATSTLDQDGAVVFRDTFDAVVVANGHYAVPHVPSIKGIARFHEAHPSVITHSKQYRKQGLFRGKRVVVVGNGPSGLDIAFQINQVALKTYLSVRHATPPAKLEHTGCEELAEIDEFIPDRRAIRFKDGTIMADIDHVVFCTGYLYSYPFLRNPDRGKLITVGRGVHGLYQHIFYIRHPTLAFVGLNIKAVPWPMAEAQAAITSAVWSNNLALPSARAMEKWTRKLEKKHGEALHEHADLDDGVYLNELYDWGQKATHRGKRAPRWNEEQLWQRSIYGEAKIRFENRGCKARTLEELGLYYVPKQKL